VADARKTTFGSGYVYVARSVTGAIAAENSTLSDANYDPTTGLDCYGYDTIFVGVEITAGSSPTITIEPLFRDSSDAPDGGRWVRIKCGVTDGVTLAGAANLDTGALASNADFTELKVFGCRRVFLRAKAVANATNTTAWKVLVMPGKVRDTTNLSRG
jgi:hypothetical protein